MLSFCVLVTTFVAESFILLPPTKSVSPSTRPRNQPIYAAADSSAGDSAYSEDEVQNMEELILSLSLEPTDESRRERLTTVFTDALAGPNGDPQRFADLFNQVLITVGDRVKANAQQKAIEAQEKRKTLQDRWKENEEARNAEKAAQATKGDAKDAPATKETSVVTKTPEEKQLWAVVDMMVQSKTIVKRASGELGSEGSFG